MRFRPGIASGFLLAIVALNGCRPPEKQTPTPSPVPLPGSAFRVEWGDAGVPKTMTAGRSAPVVVNVKNAGDTTWPDRAMGHASGSGIGAVRLAYRWWSADLPPTLLAAYGSGRADLAAPLAPGAATTLSIAVDPPASPGHYVLQLELVQELVGWFEDRGATTLKVPVDVKAAEPPAPVALGGPAAPRAPGPVLVRPAIVLSAAPPDQRGLSALVAALAFISIVPLAFGYLIVRRSGSGPAPERLAWTYVIGFAALVFALGAAATFFPARAHGPALAAGSVVLLVLTKGARGRLMNDLREGGRPALVVAAIAALGMIGLNWPSVSTGDTVFFDGHGNHDGFYNVGNASWLLDHSARDIPAWSVASPLFFSTRDLIGVHSVVTRLGAETLLAVAAATTGHDPLALYLPLLSSLLLPWLATAFLVAQRVWPRRRFPVALATAVGALQPLFVFSFANGNFPNLVGLLTCTPLLLLFRWQQTEARPPFGVLAIALATAATLATYPEVLAVTGVGLGVLVLASLGRLPLAWTARALLGMAAGAALNPLVARRAVGGLRTAIGADSSLAGGQAWFAGLRPEHFLPAAVTLSFDAARALPIALAVVVSLAIVVAVVVAWRRADDPALVWATLVPLAAVCALGWHRKMPYAYQKGVQWTALVLCVLVAVGMMECLRAPWTATGSRWPRALGRLGLAAAGAIGTLWLLTGTAAGARRMLTMAGVKRIDSAFRAVSEMAQLVPPGAAIAVRDLPLGADGFFAMWIPYFIRDHPLFFEWGEASANYLSPVVRHSARVPLARPPYVLAAAGSPRLPGETLLAGNRRFWLLAAPAEEDQPVPGLARRVPLSVDGIAAITTVGAQRLPPDGGWALPSSSKAVVVTGAALMSGSQTCPREVYLGLADAEGTVVLTEAADRFFKAAYVSAFDLPPDAACGFSARVDPARLPPGTYYFRLFQLTPDRGFYTNPVGDPRLVIGP